MVTTQLPVRGQNEVAVSLAGDYFRIIIIHKDALCVQYADHDTSMIGWIVCSPLLP